jgi:hypothetical protein
MIGRPVADPRTARPGSGVGRGNSIPAFFSEAPMLASIVCFETRSNLHRLPAGKQRGTAMTHSETYLWVSYGGTAEIVLAVVLAAMAAALVYAGLRLPLPARLPRPSRTVRILLLTTWPLAIISFPVCALIYVMHAIREHLANASANPITPFTLMGVGIIFCVIALAHNSRGWRIAFGSAVIGALAAPWIFELPFDLIVMTKTYPALPPDPALYRTLFFAPLFLIAVITLALLTLSPVARLSRATLWCLAAMLAVFAVWALFGFGYPSSPVPTTLNVVSKILALTAGLTLFLPSRAEAQAEAPAQAVATTRAWTGVM